MDSSTYLDIAFSFDATGSMINCVNEVKEKLGVMVRTLRSEIPNIRLAIIAHGDYDTQYQTKYVDFTGDADRLCTFVRGVEQADIVDEFRGLEECYELVLHEAGVNLSWRKDSQKALVMIGDCTPHEAGYSLSKMWIDWETEIINLRDKDIKIYAVQCQGLSSSESFYQTIAAKTFGQYNSLENFADVETLLLKICRREAGLEQKLKKTPVTKSAPRKKDDENWYWTSFDDRNFNEDFGCLCETCEVGKLCNEFPPEPLTDDCDHPTLDCLRCTVAYVETHGRCIHKGCNNEVQPEGKTMKWFRAILDTMFLDYNVVIANSRMALRPEGDVINVTTLSGDAYWVKYDANMTVKTLKQKVGQKFTPNLTEAQQKFIFNDKTLSSKKRLSDYNIQPNTNLHLILPLYSVSSDLDDVVFDLSWEFADMNADFLDATCMAFEGTEFVQVIDWNHSKNLYYLKNSIIHTEENLEDPTSRVGHQVIKVSLRNVPRSITHLFFTLSSWKAANLSGFKNPMLQFYDAKNKDANLCETTFEHAQESQAVIMCSVTRSGSGWEIFDYVSEGDVGLVKNGNSKRYNPIRKQIEKIIDDE